MVPELIELVDTLILLRVTAWHDTDELRRGYVTAALRRIAIEVVRSLAGIEGAVPVEDVGEWIAAELREVVTLPSPISVRLAQLADEVTAQPVEDDPF